MSNFHEEAAAAHGGNNPQWRVTFIENMKGASRYLDVAALNKQQAINKATQRLNLDFTKPEGAYYFKSCVQL